MTPGRRVMLQPGLSCGRCEACLDGRDNECPRYDVLGSQSDGGYAEFVRVPLQNLIAIPDAIGFVEAAAFPLTFLTAWHMLVTRAQVRAGRRRAGARRGERCRTGGDSDRVAARRARVCDGRHRREARAAREIGAYEVINHHTQDVAAEIRRLTNNRGVDVVIEHVGEATWERSLKCLTRADASSPAARPPVTTRRSICASSSPASTR